MAPAPLRPPRTILRRFARCLPVAIPLGILLATGFAGIDFGRHWDEWLQMRALRRAVAQEVLLPHFYNYPSVPFWLGLGALAPEILADLPTTYPELSALQAELDGFIQTHEFRLRVRGVFLALSSLALLWTYLAHLRWRGRVGEALLAATLLGLSFEFAYHARWIAPDAINAQFAALCMGLLVAGSTSAAPRRWFLAAACAAGLATGTKYTAGLLIVPVLLGLWGAARAPRRAAPEGAARVVDPRLGTSLALALGLFALTFLITTPGALLQPFSFFRDVRFEIGHYAEKGHYGFTIPSGWPHLWAQVRYLAGAALSPYEPLSWALFGLVLGGAAAALRESRRLALVLLLFPVLYLGYMGTTVVLFVRNTLLVLPFLALLGARGAGALGARLPGPAGRHLALGLAVALLVGHGGWLVHAAGTIRDRGPQSGRFVRELDSWLARRGDQLIYVAPRVQAALDQIVPRPRTNVTHDPGAPADLAVILPPAKVNQLERLPSNRPGSILRTFGPREVNLEYYWTWPEPRIVVTSSSYARANGLLPQEP